MHVGRVCAISEFGSSALREEVHLTRTAYQSVVLCKQVNTNRVVCVCVLGWWKGVTTCRWTVHGNNYVCGEGTFGNLRKVIY